MSSVIGALRVNLGLDSAKFERGVGQAQKRLASMRKQFVGISAAAAAMGAALTTAALKGAQEIDKAAKAAKRLDSSIGAFRAIELAASEAGVNLSSLTNDIQTMNRELASIGTSGNGARALDALGLKLSDLSGLDADQKLATIADRVKELGLSSGETTAIMRDLGVRNREMSLLMIQGGDAIHAARDDITAYGLAISSVDAAKIEQANDRIARLGLITQYAGQQLAMALVPALGKMAQAMTESLKAGGLLRAMIDGFTNNLHEMAGVVAVAVTAFGVRYVGALVAAKLATVTFAGALGLMKRALISTGIGALIVGAGILVGKFAELVAGVGGFGNALSHLKALAAEVWTRMGQAGQGLYLIIKGVAKGIGAAFISAFAWIGSKWDALINGMSGPFNSLMDSLGLEARIGASAIGESLQGVADEWRDSAVSSIREGGAALKSAATTPLKSLEAMRQAIKDGEAAAAAAADATSDLNDTLSDTESAGGKAAKGAGKAKKAIEQAKTEAEGFSKTLEDAALTAEELGTEKANILVGGIDGVSNAFGDFVANGFRDFKGFAKSIVDGFKSMLSQMISLAAKNRIMISLGLGGSVAGTGAAAAVGGATAPGGGGMLGNLLGLGGGAGGGGLLSGILGTAASGTGLIGGFSSVVSSFGMGGFGGAASSIGAAISGIGTASSAMTGLATAVGAIAVPVLAVAAVFSFFKKKTKILDSGVRLTVDGMDTLIESFKKVETSRFWGLSKKVSTQFEALEDEAAAPFIRIVDGIQEGVLQAADALGVGADAFNDFAFQMKVSTKGLSDEEAQEAITEALQSLSDEFAAMVPGLADLQREGEGAHATLQRVVGELYAVNQALYLFDRALLEASISGAGMASELVELAGGLEAFGTKTQYVFENMLTTAAREMRLIEMATDQLNGTFEDLALTIPATHAQFMALMDAQDLTTAGGRKTYAALMDVAQAFVTVNGNAQSVAEAAEQMAEKIKNERLGLEGELLRLTGQTVEIRRRELAALDPTNRGLQEAIYRLEDMQTALSAFDAATAENVEAIKARYAAANETLEAQLSAVDAQIAAASKAAEDLYNAQAAEIDARLDRTVSLLNRAVDAAADALSTLEDNLSAIRGALASRGPIGAEQQAASYRSAQAALAAFAAGQPYAPDQLESALSGVSGDTAQMFGSLQEMLIDAAETTAILADLEAQAADQMSLAERHLAAQERSVLYAEEEAERDKEFYKDQLGVLEETQSIYRSMDQALAAVKQFSARREDITRMIEANQLGLERELNQFALLRSEARRQIEATYSVRDALAGLTGALTGGTEKAFAKGAVISGATRMIMAGGMGQMAEAGPEAVMPLARGPGGSLGVQVHGANLSTRPAARPRTGTANELKAELANLREVVTLLKEVKTAAQTTAKSTEGMYRSGTKVRA